RRRHSAAHREKSPARIAARMSAASRTRKRTLCSDNSLSPSSSSATNRCRRYPREYVVHVSQSQVSSNGFSSSRYSALRMLRGPAGVKRRAVATIARRCDEVEQVPAAPHRRHEIRREAHAHKITRARWQLGPERREHFVHYFFGLTHRKPADSEAGPPAHVLN